MITLSFSRVKSAQEKIEIKKQKRLIVCDGKKSSLAGCEVEKLWVSWRRRSLDSYETRQMISVVTHLWVSTSSVATEL